MKPPLAVAHAWDAQRDTTQTRVDRVPHPRVHHALRRGLPHHVESPASNLQAACYEEEAAAEA